jgi:hypothetical protein
MENGLLALTNPPSCRCKGSEEEIVPGTNVMPRIKNKNRNNEDGGRMLFIMLFLPRRV